MAYTTTFSPILLRLKLSVHTITDLMVLNSYRFKIQLAENYFLRRHF